MEPTLYSPMIQSSLAGSMASWDDGKLHHLAGFLLQGHPLEDVLHPGLHLRIGGNGPGPVMVPATGQKAGSQGNGRSEFQCKGIHIVGALVNLYFHGGAGVTDGDSTLCIRVKAEGMHGV